MRDPFAETDVEARRAVLITAIVVVSATLLVIARPAVAATIAVIAAFFVMILFHEAGHFVTAKWTHMKATEFFVGFGPRLWSRRRGETEYGVKAFPLGGYVKIVGMTNIEEVDPEDEPRAYRSKGYGAKLLVASAGSAVHFLIAGVLMFAVLAAEGDLPAAVQRPVIGAFPETAEGEQLPSAARTAGLEPGDRVRSIDGVATENWTDLRETVQARPGESVDVVVERDGELLEVPVDLAATERDGETVGQIGVIVDPSALDVPSLSPLGAAARTPGAVFDVGRQSVEALGRVFSPTGVSEYFETVSGGNDGEAEANDRFISPVGFGRVANQAVQAGWVAVFGLLIAINVFVGIFNLVPLLPFDGGHIAIATYERVASAVRGRRVVVDVNKLMPITVGVVAVLGFIFLSSLFLDVTRPVENPF